MPNCAVPLTFDLKHDGGALTGTINGLPTENCEIKDGKVDGSTVTFWLMTEYQGNAIKLVWTGKIGADQIGIFRELLRQYVARTFECCLVSATSSVT